MKVTKKEVVDFLVALGFGKAVGWKPSKLKDMLLKAPNKVTEEDVPEEFGEFFTKLNQSKGRVEFVEADGASEKPAVAKEGKKPKAEKKSKVSAKEEAKRDAYGCRIGSISEKVNTALTKLTQKSEDKEGWVTEEEIAQEAGVTLDQARGRIYYAVEEGDMESRRLVQVRLAKKSSKK